MEVETQKANVRPSDVSGMLKAGFAWPGKDDISREEPAKEVILESTKKPGVVERISVVPLEVLKRETGKVENGVIQYEAHAYTFKPGAKDIADRANAYAVVHQVVTQGDDAKRTSTISQIAPTQFTAVDSALDLGRRIEEREIGKVPAKEGHWDNRTATWGDMKATACEQRHMKQFKEDTRFAASRNLDRDRSEKISTQISSHDKGRGR